MLDQLNGCLHPSIQLEVHIMFHQLDNFLTRPAPFSIYTADALWTTPHIARQMLSYHLNEETDLASRRPEIIDGMVNWIARTVDIAGKSVCDLGCGPGLYALRLAQRGARMTGIDFSEVSISHAKTQFEKMGLPAHFAVQDYLKSSLPSHQDLFLLIYGDYCVLSPDQRKALLKSIHDSLNSGGCLILDAIYKESLDGQEEALSLEPDMMGGFWAPSPYYGFKKVFHYPDETLSLDRYLIVQPGHQFEIFNWFKYFTPQELCDELKDSGFVSAQVVDALTGEPISNTIPEQFAVIAHRD